MKLKVTAVLLSFATFSAYAAGPVAVTMKNAKGESVGTATVSDVAKGIKIELVLHGLPAGEHGFHVHEKGACIPPKFDSAGGHFNPTKHGHGFDNQEGFHGGDMSNIVVGADGTLKTEIINTALTLDSGPTGLLNVAGGTAFIIHEKADDYKSQPAGNAGARLACGEIKR